MKKTYSKKRVTPQKDKSLILAVTPEQYQGKLARGGTPDEMLPPGRYQFERGGFRRRMGLTPEDVAAAEVKVRITIYLDADVVDYFKERAKAPRALPYQTQINDELRRVMEGAQSARVADPAAQLKAALLDDEQFIKALSQRLGKRRRKAA